MMLWPLVWSSLVLSLTHGHVDPEVTLDCHRRLYSYQVAQSDSQGRSCHDTINVMSCWGRCDSNEVSDWRFPYKRSYHPVCLHKEYEDTTTVLRNCDEGVEPGTELYQLRQAITCTCTVCKSSVASCEGLRAWNNLEAQGLAGREA